jgi:hypothetical protein
MAALVVVQVVRVVVVDHLTMADGQHMAVVVAAVFYQVSVEDQNRVVVEQVVAQAAGLM